LRRSPPRRLSGSSAKEPTSLFANEKEITSLYEVNSFAEAADAALADCELAVLTRSAKAR
jgi:fructokinase